MRKEKVLKNVKAFNERKKENGEKQYLIWLDKEHQAALEQARSITTSNTEAIKLIIERSEFWRIENE